MSEFTVNTPLPHIPDNLTIPQFILREIASPRPQRSSSVPFFIDDKTGRRISYEEVHKRTYGLANALSLKYAIGKGDVVCLLSPNHTDYATVIWAVQTLGGIITPANPSYTADELTHQLTTSKAKLIVTHSVCRNAALEASRASGISGDRLVLLVDPTLSPTVNSSTVEDLIAFGISRPQSYKAQCLLPGEARTTLAFLSFSSGTTGKPKAVEISHFAVIANVIQMAAHYQIYDPVQPSSRMLPGDIALAVLPFFHIYGLVVMMHYILYCGMSIVVVPKFNFSSFLDSIIRHKVTHLFLVPPQIVLLCKHQSVQNYDFSHVKYCLSGAAPLSGELMEQVTSILPNASIGQGYGLTETCASVALLPPDRKLATIGSAGRLLPGIVARVLKPDGTFAAEGEQGELVVTGPSMALRYMDNPKATAETFVGGWVRTGDEVIIKDLEVFVVDRLKEIIKVRGFQVSPAELEGHLLLHPDAVDACVVGVPHDYSGELPLAFVVLESKARQRVNNNRSEEQTLKRILCKHVSDAKAQYKWLAGGIEFVDEIPKNPSGKILRRLLREKAKALAKPVTARL